MKKLFFAGLLLPLTLCSCKSGSNDYKMSKEKYLELFNPHTITLRTNYQIDIDAFGNRQTTEFDNGYANRIDLYSLGVDDSQINDDHLDTYTDERLFSAYKKTPVGRLVSLIYLK